MKDHRSCTLGLGVRRKPEPFHEDGIWVVLESKGDESVTLAANKSRLRKARSSANNEQ